MTDRKTEVEGFYLRCAEILQVPHTYDHQPRIARRWNRKLGNGRFEGYGLIRVYGDGAHVCIRHPVKINQMFSTWDEVYDVLRIAVDQLPQPVHET